MAGTRKAKRDSSQVDKLIAEVEKLHRTTGLSINKACQKLGLQPTVYYFRKRKDEAMNKLESISSNSAPVSKSVKGLHEHRDIDELTREYRELEARLQCIKMQIAEKVMSKSL